MIKQPLVSLTNLVKTYQIGDLRNTILNEISLTVEEGELLAIVGASGSGKTTLMNIIGLLDTADSGHYWLQGHLVKQLSNDELATLRNQRMGFVFQQFNLLPRLNALQNVALPLTYRNLPQDQIHEQVMQALSRVGMQTFIKHRPTQLSGGQQQRVAIARALVSKPQVILADEPTGSLDSRTGAEVMNLFHSLHQEGRTLILITHDEHIAAQCTRRITLADGQIVAETL